MVELNKGKSMPTEKFVDIIASKAASISPGYGKAIPLANERGLRETVAALTDPSNATQLTAFYNILGQIGVQNFHNVAWEDPLTKHFYKGTMEYGSVVQNVIIPMMEGLDYQFSNASQVFAFSEPDLHQYFGTINKQKVYPVTISIPQMRRILKSGNTPEDGIQNLYNKIIGTLASSAERDNTRYVMNTLKLAVADGGVTYVKVGDMTDKEQVLKILTIMQTVSKELRWTGTNNKYNRANMDNPIKVDDLLTFMTQEFRSYTDVNIESQAFNRDKLDIMGTVEEIPPFDNNVLAVMMSKDFIQAYSVLNEQASNSNAATLTEHIYKHVWDMYFYISCFPCVAFVKELPEGVPDFTVHFRNAETLVSTPINLGKEFDVIASKLDDKEKYLVKVTSDSPNKLIDIKVKDGKSELSGETITPDSDGLIHFDVTYKDLDTLKLKGVPEKFTLAFQKVNAEGTAEDETITLPVNIYPNESAIQNGDGLTPQFR